MYCTELFNCSYSQEERSRNQISVLYGVVEMNYGGCRQENSLLNLANLILFSQKKVVQTRVQAVIPKEKFGFSTNYLSFYQAASFHVSHKSHKFIKGSTLHSILRTETEFWQLGSSHFYIESLRFWQRRRLQQNIPQRDTFWVWYFLLYWFFMFLDILSSHCLVRVANQKVFTT